MASTVAMRKASVALFSKLTNPVSRPASAVGSVLSRSLSTAAKPDHTDSSQEDALNHRSPGRNVASRRREDAYTSPSLLSDWIDPFTPTRTLGQVFNLMDQLMDPFMSSSRGLGGGASGSGLLSNRGWDVKEDDHALQLRMDMPGLCKEDIKVSVEKDTLIIKGEAKESTDEDGDMRKYSTRIQLPPNVYKVDGIKGEMKNGVLKLLVPKLSETDGKRVLEVKVE